MKLSSAIDAMMGADDSLVVELGKLYSGEQANELRALLSEMCPAFAFACALIEGRWRVTVTRRPASERVPYDA